ncbi:RluB protein [Ruminococcus sp. OM06-36AC]|nr:RluB protein [Ruminococcus sp. OM06-36AC]
MRSYIALDGNNQYIIIGRNPTGLLLNIDEVYELQNENVDGITLFTLKKSF